jgi:putative membrane protein
MIYYKLIAQHWIGLIILGIWLIFASIQPLEYFSYMLHQIGTFLMLIVLFFCLKKFGLSLISFQFYLGFLVIHILGAHYLYSYVPYNEWSIQYLNFDMNKAMGWTRNMYDRLVHFSYGLLLYPFFLRLFQIWLPQLSPKILFILVVQFVMATSLIYEWIEWLIAIGLSPEEAENYNGQQGDIWDAHKDMLIATIGSIITGLIMLSQTNKKALI